MKQQTCDDEKERISERLKFAARVAEFILTETLLSGGYEINAGKISEQSEIIAENICLYCGANEGVDFFNDNDVIGSAVYLMSEGQIVYSASEIENLRDRIKKTI